MMKSMTGYGKKSVAYANKSLVVEIRSLNSRTLEINLRLPSDYRELDNELRSMIGNTFGRGKVDCYITLEDNSGTASYTLNRPLARFYLNEISTIASQSEMAVSGDVLAAILRLPDVVGKPDNEVSDEEKQHLMQAIQQALQQADEFRIHEGAILFSDIEQRVKLILELLEQIHPFEAGRIIQVRERLSNELKQLDQNIQVDRNRFEQELIYYLERIDFTEEKVRLKKHCQYFLEIMNEPESQGRKLNFVAQEIGREMNTIGSKANHSSIQHLVVSMKDELEKIKEQLLNIL